MLEKRIFKEISANGPKRQRSPPLQNQQPEIQQFHAITGASCIQRSSAIGSSEIAIEAERGISTADEEQESSRSHSNQGSRGHPNTSKR